VIGCSGRYLQQTDKELLSFGADGDGQSSEPEDEEGSESDEVPDRVTDVRDVLRPVPMCMSRMPALAA
jgi:hypothetical protein